MPDLRTTPLHSRHVALGASFTDFGGWSMPVRYSSDLAEHRAVREAAGLFDISHMAEFEVRGPDAGAFLDAALAGTLSSLADDRARYTLLLAPDGGIVDDLIVYRHAAHRFLVIANAANHDVDVAALRERIAGFDAELDDVTDRIALLALQGPAALAILGATAGLTAPTRPLAQVPSYGMSHATFAAAGESPVPIHLLRTGYTGEDGFELAIRPAAAPALWDALVAAGSDHGLTPAGLAARDTLRLEAGMPLYGHELTRDTLPAQVGLARVVAPEGDFVGADAARAPLADDAPVLVGLVADGRRAGRAGYVVRSGDRAVGEITSGALSPTLGHPIALAHVAPDVAAPGTALAIDVRGTLVPATVTAPPFYRRNKK